MKRRAARASSLVGAHRQPLRVRRGDAPAALGSAGVGPQRQPVLLQSPPARGCLRDVDGPGRALDVRAVGLELYLRPPACPGQRVARPAEDDLPAGVLLVRAHPAAVKQVLLHQRPASTRRGPASVAFIRATWPTVNMNIASSSV